MRTRKLIEKCILFAIASISKDIEDTMDEEENARCAETIKTLAEAYDIVHRGKKGE